MVTGADPAATMMDSLGVAGARENGEGKAKKEKWGNFFISFESYGSPFMFLKPCSRASAGAVSALVPSLGFGYLEYRLRKTRGKIGDLSPGQSVVF